MAVKIYNTLTGKKELFKPLRRGRIGMYVCGVTVYDRCHLGHARSAVAFDVIRRYLRYKKYRVKFIRNFTDIDDKIIQRANREGQPWTEIVKRYLAAYDEDMNRVRVEKPDGEPKATEYIPDMVRLIQRLVKKGFAYTVDGDVYYRVEKFKGYGKLSKRKSDELMAGARVEPDERKKSPLDFALWKSAKPGEPFWDSPWGPGRPGWHIECSAMSMKLLGDSFDIHGGGMDLIFPHHENEIAQSEAATQKPFARYWVHNGFVNINKEKMSKSLGNFFTIQEIFEKSNWPDPITAEVLRYFLVSTQYRSPIDFSDEALKAAKAGLDNFYRMFQKLEEQTEVKPKTGGHKLQQALKRFTEKFEAAMDDDFNTALAISEMQRLRAGVNTSLDKGLPRVLSQRVLKLFRKYGSLLGLFSLSTGQWNTAMDKAGSKTVTASDKVMPVGLLPSAIEVLIQERNEARRTKDWARADAVRKQLSDAGVILEDRPDGTTRVRR
jgi:cysteinyl-tRNA synthetase